MNVLVANTGKGQLLQYKAEAEAELKDILDWWCCYMVDEQQGGFYGSVNNENLPDLSVAKGIVLNSRILWTFSAAYSFTQNELHVQLADRAYEYIRQFFLDKEYGGVYWSVDNKGNMLEGKKQVYGLAFCMYALAEYYKVSTDDEVLELAKRQWKLLERYSFDKEKGGYIEAFTREWQPVADLRLSEKDDNERKTMNTHLHIIEAYANLYLVSPDEELKKNILNLLEVFDQYIINKETNHLNLFMNDDWQVKSTLQSFGHDIEAAWLLQECAEIAGDANYVRRYKEIAVSLAEAAAEGLDKDGALWYEYEPVHGHWIKEKHSWPQAEAMVGFINAYSESGNEKYLEASIAAFNYIKKNIKNNQQGEWYWGRKEDGTVMEKEKAGFWKCPYHSGRACMEIIKRVDKMLIASG